MRTDRALSFCSLALLLGVLPLIAAHGNEDGMAMGDAHSMETSHTAVADSTKEPVVAPSYFRHPEYQGWLYAHIATMVLAWIVALPIGIMLSVARSRLAIPAQACFLAVNGLGLFTSIVYNAKTPDLYPNNAHHKIGWIATWIAVAWFVMAFPVIYRRKENTPRHSMTAQNMEHYNRLQGDDGFSPRHMYRWSRDSGHETDNSATLCSGSRTPSSESVPQHKLEPQSPMDEENGQDYHDHDEQEAAESSGFLRTSTRVERLLSSKLSRFNLSGRAFVALKVTYVFIERSILVLAFVAFCSGGVTWGNLFRDRMIFSGLAHFVKGGIFFWYGLLTLGRWMGAFSDFGWAWNVKPQKTMISRFAARLPSAEFVESFVIWLYGASNIFLEHLNAWGQEWSFEDFEHISITVLFFGGGLLGMLVESENFKNLFNAAVELKKEESVAYNGQVEEQRQEWSPPKSYKHSLNPMPSLVILLLGRMMGGHVQSSMVSTMMHAQWGSLFVGFALARAATYILMYVSPPTSYFPSRPPSELVASFCLVSGGMIFMCSATDTVKAIEMNGLDAMFLFTVAMGFSALIMAWSALTFAVKGWAMRRDAKRV